MKLANIEVTLIDHMGSDLSVVNAARVSFSKESSWNWNDEFQEYEEGMLKSGDKKLINYLAKHKHHSPFNHAFLSFRVKAPIFIARQLVKHKFLPWNEVSRRYVDEEPEFYFPDYWRAKAENVKQGSSNDEVFFGPPEVYVTPEESIAWALSCYEGALRLGVCPEQARMVLPQNTMTEWYWSGTLGAFLDMLVLRLDNHTQKETRDVANLIAKHVQCVFPVSYEAYLGAKGETS